MIQTVRKAWAIPELRKKITFTLLILLIYRIGNAISVPYVDTDLLGQYLDSMGTTVLGLYNVMSGGAFAMATVFALGIQPYINSSIIIQLLTVAIPALERMAREGGEAGKRKIQSITRYATVAIAILQAFGYYMLMKNYGILTANGTGIWPALVIIVSFVAGSSFLMWLGEQVNEFGVGNGISMILFAGIISRVPSAVSNLYYGIRYWMVERSGGTRGRMPAKKTADFARRGNVNLLIDIQKKMEAGKGKGYERWAKIFNLKEAAKTLNFLVDNGLTDYDGLLERAEEIRVKFEETSARMKQLEGRMAQTAQMKTHIINYSKTREVYAAYKKARNKGKFRAEHRAEIEKHEAAKRAFDALGGKDIPKVAQLTEEYGRLLEEKQDRYEEYRSLKKEMLEYQTIRQNVDRILEMPELEKMRDKEQQTR